MAVRREWIVNWVYRFVIVMGSTDVTGVGEIRG